MIFIRKKTNILACTLILSTEYWHFICELLKQKTLNGLTADAIVHNDPSCLPANRRLFCTSCHTDGRKVNSLW